MSEDTKEDTKSVRSKREIKESLLRRVWSGQSGRTGREMMALIQEYTSRGRSIPSDHEAELKQIDDGEPRAVRALNLLEKEKGSPVRYRDFSREEAFAKFMPPSPTFH